MDSSDSEDDCYGNIAQKLQSMKNKYTEDKIDTTNLLNESAELDELMSKNGRTASQTAPAASSEVIVADEVSAEEDSEEVLNNILSANSSKRMTRSAAKRNSSNVSLTEVVPKKQSRRKTANSSNDSSSVPNVNTEQCNVNQSNRGRGRGKSRSRNRRSRGMWVPTHHNTPILNDLPIYSVGNTHEYPDQSESQGLFSSSSNCNNVVLIDDNELDQNEELSVKVYWQSSELFKFMIRRFQKLSQLFDYFSKKEGVENDQLLLTYKDRILKPDDTPDSIDYSVAKFIDGGIVKQSVLSLVTNKNSNSNVKSDGIRLKFQCQNVKKPFETVVGIDEKLSIAMMKCAEYLDTTVDRLKFEFDGDPITCKNTPNELNLQEDECIDVRIK